MAKVKIEVTFNTDDELFTTEDVANLQHLIGKDLTVGTFIDQLPSDSQPCFINSVDIL